MSKVLSQSHPWTIRCNWFKFQLRPFLIIWAFWGKTVRLCTCIMTVLDLVMARTLSLSDVCSCILSLHLQQNKAKMIKLQVDQNLPFNTSYPPPLITDILLIFCWNYFFLWQIWAFLLRSPLLLSLLLLLPYYLITFKECFTTSATPKILHSIPIYCPRKLLQRIPRGKPRCHPLFLVQECVHPDFLNTAGCGIRSFTLGDNECDGLTVNLHGNRLIFPY